MSGIISRRSLVKGAAGAGAAGALALGSKHSTVFATPNIISQTGSNTEITFWYGVGANIGQRLQDLVAAFNALGNGITVTAVQQASYDETGQNLTLALQDKSYPDVALMSEIWWFRFYLANALLPMDDLIASTGFDIDDMVDSLRIEGFRNGGQYWLPVSASLPIMYYNKGMYEAAGLPGPATTYTQLAEYGAALTDADKQVFGLGFPGTGSYSWQFQGQVWSYGGAYGTEDFQVTLNQEANVQAGEWLRSAASDGWLSVSQDVVTDFASGYLATIIRSAGGLNTLTEQATANGVQVGTAILPGEVAGIDKTCPTGPSGLSIFSGVPAERQAAAFEFLSYWNSPEIAASWAQNTGYMPTRKSAVASSAMQEFFAANPNYKVAVDQLATRARPQDVVRRLVPSGEKIIGDALSSIVLNDAPVQDAFDTAAATLQADAQAVADQIVALEGDLTTGSIPPVIGTPVSTPIASR